MKNLYPSVATVLACTLSVLTALSYTDQAGHAQTSQYRESDLDFTSRLSAQADSLQTQVSDLDVRLSKLEEAAAKEPVLAATQAQSSTGTREDSSIAADTTTTEQRVPERLRHKDRAAGHPDLHEIRTQLQTLDRQIQAEQDRLNAIRGEQSGSTEADLQKLQQQVQALDAELRYVERTAGQ